MIIQMMGPQACGKGTQAKMLGNLLNLPIVGVGDLLRGMSKDHPQYKLVHDQMAKGELVDHAITSKILMDHLAKSEYANGFILDGWARIVDQFKYYDPNPDLVFFINIPHEEIIRRISGRRICEPTGETFNINTMTEEEIKACPGPLIQRKDDTEDAIKERLEIFYRDTTPVIEKYRRDGKLVEIDGMGSPAEVFERIKVAIAQKTKS